MISRQWFSRSPETREIMVYSRTIYSKGKWALSLLVVVILLSMNCLPVTASTTPTIEIVNVVVDQTVTVRTAGFPANERFTLRMGDMGTQGVNGMVIDTIDSGVGGALDITCGIPPELKGKAQIAIRLESAGGYFAYNWFYNHLTPSASAPAGALLSGYRGIPTIQILRVDNDDVTLMGINFPAYQMFTVRMGKNGTRGIDGKVVAVTDTGLGGAFEVTYHVPQALSTQARVAIRLENENGFYSYNWFTMPGAESMPAASSAPISAPVSSLIPPTLSIQSVERDRTVKILLKGLPTNQTYSILMGYMGTKGVGGIHAGSFTINNTDDHEISADIPAQLLGQDRIAIRVDGPSGYYAYNWFYNTSTY